MTEISSVASSLKITGRKPSLQLQMATPGFAIVLFTVIAGAAGADLLKRGVKADDGMPFGRRSGDELIGEQRGRALAVGAAGKHDDFHGNSLVFGDEKVGGRGCRRQQSRG